MPTVDTLARVRELVAKYEAAVAWRVRFFERMALAKSRADSLLEPAAAFEVHERWDAKKPWNREGVARRRLIRFLFKATGTEIRDVNRKDPDDMPPHVFIIDGTMWLASYDDGFKPLLRLKSIPMSEVVELKGGDS